MKPLASLLLLAGLFVCSIGCGQNSSRKATPAAVEKLQQLPKGWKTVKIRRFKEPVAYAPDSIIASLIADGIDLDKFWDNVAKEVERNAKTAK